MSNLEHVPECYRYLGMVTHIGELIIADKECEKAFEAFYETMLEVAKVKGLKVSELFPQNSETVN